MQGAAGYCQVETTSGRVGRSGASRPAIRAIFDRYNIINEQELLEAGDQLVAYLAQHARATPPGGRPHPARTAAPRTAPPLRLVRRTTA